MATAIHQEDDESKAPDAQEERWEEANCSAAAYTPHSSQRIHFFTPLTEGCSNIDIESVDTSSMSLLDVCNYVMEEEEVDGSGHCVWMGALFFAQAISIGSVYHSSSSSCSWYNEAYFQNQAVAEMGCGTGAAGIALLKILSLQEAVLPKQLTFLDNDSDALNLCRKNCQRNDINDSMYDIHVQQPWTDLSIPGSTEDQPSEEFRFDTILATDVLYDLKIIRPFLQTAYRFLARSEAASNKHLILSHVPRWFLPREVAESNTEPYDASRALEEHIAQVASQFHFQLVHTVRPAEVVAQYEDVTQHYNREIIPALLEALQEMDEAKAVLWVFELQPRT